MQSSQRSAVMNFLNEVAERFPSAISLAAGRPTEVFFDRLHGQALVEAFATYEESRATATQGRSGKASLLQYGRTAGLVADMVAKQLRLDDGIDAAPEQLLITAGCQEAIALCLSALCTESSDVALALNPTYIGFTGAADTLRIPIEPLNAGHNIAAELEKKIGLLHSQHRRPRVLYLTPEFDNPTGCVIDLDQRIALIDMCARHRIVILEDNPYGMFRYEGTAVPTMMSVDEHGCVIYLSTYSKTICPALRVGAAVLPRRLFGDAEAAAKLHGDISQRKSFITVNTSQIAQAMVGGLLIKNTFSLRHWIAPAVDLYRTQRDAMLAELELAFGHDDASVSWNRPQGGFFLTLQLPFDFQEADVINCATNYGVIVMPMAFFAFDESQNSRVRLAFSSGDATRIEEGVRRLARYVVDRCDKAATLAEAVA